MKQPEFFKCNISMGDKNNLLINVNAMVLEFFFFYFFCYCLIKTETRPRQIKEQEKNKFIVQGVIKLELDFFIKEFHNSFRKE